MELPQPEEITLRDGTAVTLRAIQPEDAPRLQALFSRLSPESVFLRFLAVMKELPEEEARALATLDYHRRMAFVAACRDNGEERLIGVARYAVVEGTVPGLAEAAVAVEDGYQRRGLGSTLLNRLTAYARSHGVTTFLATVHSSNDTILRFIRRSGLSFESRAESGTWEVHIKLDRDVTF